MGMNCFILYGEWQVQDMVSQGHLHEGEREREQGNTS
jgi:hypothetical protein